jgi:chaperonin cofactor prefoldin
MSEEKSKWQRENIETSIDQLQARLTLLVESQRDILDRCEAVERKGESLYERGKSYIDAHISGLEQTMNARHDTVLSEIRRLDQRIDQLQARVERIERQLESSL